MHARHRATRRSSTISACRDRKRYIHHYDFPPYSVGEARPLRSPGRRDIGHGALAERALEPVTPAAGRVPLYACASCRGARESNGSTSMGSVCGSTLALMDAGVPIKAPVGGIAMGLIKDGAGDPRSACSPTSRASKTRLGDMDFKVAGTARRRHRPPDGHQDQGHFAGDSVEGARAGAGRAHVDPRRDRAPLPAPRRICRRTRRGSSRFTSTPSGSGVIGPGGKAINADHRGDGRQDRHRAGRPRADRLARTRKPRRARSG